ncbi:MAG: hypothetical protein AAF604_17680 [Acidobacteriota bacterium]
MSRNTLRTLPWRCIASLLLIAPAAPIPAEAPDGSFELPVPEIENTCCHRLAADLDGDLMLVWQRFQPSRIEARIYDPHGHPRSEVIAVSGSQTNDERSPNVTSDGQGNFLVTWQAWPPLLDRAHVVSRRFDHQGRPLTGALRVSETAASLRFGTPPAMATAPDGTSLVVWEEPGLFPLIGRMIGRDGKPARSPFEITERRELPSLPRVAVGNDGTFAVSFEDYTDLGVDQRLMARTFTARGEPRAPTRVLPTDLLRGISSTTTAIAASGSGDFVVIWADLPEVFDNYRMHSLLLDSEARPRTRPTPIQPQPQGDDNVFPQLVGDRFGGLLAAWRSFGLASKGRRLDALGRGLGEVFELPDAPFTVTASPAGGAVIAWREPGNLSALRIPLHEGCVTQGTDLCLRQRFRIRTLWRDPRTGRSGTARAAAVTAETGSFWFFDQDNLELFVKILDGRPVNGRHWMFWTGLTDLELWMVVEDTLTGTAETYYNPPATLPAQADTRTFEGTAESGKRQPPTAPSGPSSPVAAGEPLAELLQGRFRLRVDFEDPRSGQRGAALAIAVSDQTAAFSFFSGDNLELFVKVLDGRPVNGSFWVFRAALTNLAFTLTIEDTETGSVRIYDSPAGTLRSEVDLEAF